MGLLSIPAAPQSLVFDLTGKCNLRCRYCCFFHSDSESDLPDLPTERWLALLKEAGDACVMHISLRGGEPLTRPDFKEIVQGIVENRMRFILQTNGTLLTPEMADFIRAAGRCDRCVVSIDGTEETHDALRGKGSWQGAVRGAKLLQERGIPLQITATVHRRNLTCLADTAHCILEKLALPQLVFSLASDLSGTPPDLALAPAEFYEALRRIAGLEKHYSAQQLPAKGARGMLSLWQKLLAAEKAGRLPEQPIAGRCGTLCKSLVVRSDGAFVPCTKLSGDILGYAGRDRLLDIWRKSQVLQKFRTHTITDFPPKCKNCPYLNGCPISCPARPRAVHQGYSCLCDYLAGGGSFDV